MSRLILYKDEETRNAVYAAEDVASVQKIVNDNGVPMTEKDAENFVAAVNETCDHRHTE